MSGRLRFLVIDDCEPVLAVYSQLLDKAGHDVVCLTSGSHALEKIKTLQPDCVLCDLMLPGIDGLSLFKNLRSETGIRQPVFIIISAKHYDYDRRHAFSLGVDGYLTKPINQETFIHDINTIIEKANK